MLSDTARSQKDVSFTIVSNRLIAKNVYELSLEGDTSSFTAPGQFCNIALQGFYLRRPISVCSYGENSLILIYKTVGQGTKYLAGLGSGEQLSILTGLGNGFDVPRCGEKTLVVGGGVGVPPMYGLAQALKAAGRQVHALLGWNTADEVFYAEKFAELGVPVTVCTADGSVGVKGFVTDALGELDYDCVCACGPEPMLRALYNATECDGQYSFEERMACGFGACMGCTCATKYGSKRICRDGPVLFRDEIVF